MGLGGIVPLCLFYYSCIVSIFLPFVYIPSFSSLSHFIRAKPAIYKKKKKTARDVTGFCAFFSAWKLGNFLHILGRFLTK